MLAKFIQKNEAYIPAGEISQRDKQASIHDLEDQTKQRCDEGPKKHSNYE